MKNTSSEPEVTIFRKKGFFVALYSCLGAVAILALVITIANFGQPSYQADDYDYDHEAAEVAADQVEPYRTQVDEEAWFRPRATPEPEVAPTPTPEPRFNPPSTSPLPQMLPSIDDESDEDQAEQTSPTPPPAAEDEASELPSAAFEPFTTGDELLWPVNGDIAMVFSMDALVFDPTLVQFRTNDNLRIYAEEGAHVQASANGEVIAIGSNVVRGNYVKIDHGDGWIATYGQLADNKLVRVGDVVQAGQLLGTVGEPSIFGTMHGPHVNLRVTHDDVPVNPYELLATR